MAIFKRPTDEAAFFTPSPGTVIGELKALDEFNKGKYGPSMRWTWVLFDINTKQPILFNDKPATYDALSGVELNPGTKARAWANKHLAPEREVAAGEDPDKLERDLIGKRVRLNFSLDVDENDKEVVKLTSLLAYTG